MKVNPTMNKRLQIGDKVVDGILKREFTIVAIHQVNSDTFYELDIPAGTLDQNGCDHGNSRNPYECFGSFADPNLAKFDY